MEILTYHFLGSQHSPWETSGSQMNRLSAYLGTTRFYSGPIGELLPKYFAKVAQMLQVIFT